MLNIFYYNSSDVIFSNWLMMYLTDEEVLKLANMILSWLKEDGFIFFRESCYHQSGANIVTCILLSCLMYWFCVVLCCVFVTVEPLTQNLLTQKTLITQSDVEVLSIAFVCKKYQITQNPDNIK